MRGRWDVPKEMTLVDVQVEGVPREVLLSLKKRDNTDRIRRTPSVDVFPYTRPDPQCPSGATRPTRILPKSRTGRYRHGKHTTSLECN